MSDRRTWEERYAVDDRGDRPPSRWVVDTVGRVAPNDLPALDLAGGTGRHARTMIQAGFRTVLVDFAEVAVHVACRRAPALAGVVAAAAGLPFRPRSFGLVVVTNYLDRDVLPALADLLAPGGSLVFETYTTHHLTLVERGLARGPTTTAYLLRPGELRELASPLAIVEYDELEVNDEAGRRHVARVLASKPNLP